MRFPSAKLEELKQCADTDYPDDYSFESGLKLRESLSFYPQLTEWHTQQTRSSGKIPETGKSVNPQSVRIGTSESADRSNQIT